MKPKTQPTRPALPAQKFTFHVTCKMETKFLFSLPDDYKPGSAQRWPLLFFLHGSGERGTNVQRAAIHGPLSHVKEGRSFPFIIVAPLCPEKQLWENAPLLRLLDHVTKKFAVDTSRIFLTGLSMGGYGTWSLGLAHPEKFAAIAPICGGANAINIILGSRDKGVNFKNLPIWAFHGAKDDVVPVSESKRVVNLLRRNGATNVKLTVYPETKHDSWKEAYRGTDLYEWFLSHSLPDERRSGK
ncbi:MAG: prolyl oligopeptidase family serine peptidase [Verrucomicrobia bacterium]|nr:prolyl oligopeptidase family serine peptidase [Verrucomicrobiota bacterium]